MSAGYAPLPPPSVERIVEDAFVVLERIGVAFHEPAAAALVLEHGGIIERERVRLPRGIVERALAPAPPVIRLFDTRGALTHEIGGNNQYFTPGSSAVSVLDPVTWDARPPVTADYVAYVQIVEQLRGLASQSTAFVPVGVPRAVSDSYRLYLSLLHGTKPVVTGTFSAASTAVMEDLLLVVRGSRDALAAKPLAIYTCCPTTPLAWSADSAATLMACARAGIPVEIVPMPLAGFIAPVSLAGTLVQHTAEVLSGVVLAQLSQPGAPVLFGSAATIFDVRFETTPLGAAEGMLLACGAAQIGRAFMLPTQAYVGLSDAKLLDAQAGLETAAGAVAAGLAGVNQVAGAGMLDFVNCFSLEKLVVDHEICGMAARMRAGIGEPSASIVPLLEELLAEGHLLIAGETRRHLRREIAFPGPVVDRASRQRWVEEGRRSLAERAGAEIQRLRRSYRPPERAADVSHGLTERMAAELRRHGMDAMPEMTCAT